MLWIFILALATSIHAQVDIKAYRPCFERYPNNRLVGVQPYHSEWRMKSEDSCLLFCAQTASRCRSVVFDSVQHICHYFLDDGQNVAVPAARMIYLRVTAENCLDQTRSNQEGENIRVAQIPLTPVPASLPSPKVTVHMPEETSARKPVSDQAWIKKKSTKTVEKAQSFRGSFESDSVEEYRRDIRPFDQQERYTSSMEKLEKIDDDRVFKKKRFGLQNSREELSATKARLESDLRKKLEHMKDRYPVRYSEYVGPAQKMAATVPPTTTTTTTTTPKPTTTTTIPTTTIISIPAQKRPMKKIQFTESMMYPKKIARIGDIRRKPSATEKPEDAPSYIPKAMSFLDAVNGDVKPESVKPKKQRKEPITDVCGPDDSPIWVTFENSLDKEQDSIDSSSFTKEECQDMCNQMGCKSYSFFEREVQCMINENSDGVYLKAAPKGDFSASTSVKFCYAKSLPIFRDCSTFVGFREYALDISPKEQFDGLPTGYQGMQLCLELCVLSTDYTCRSASFFVDEGRCLLNAHDSISKPEDFRPTNNDGQLYFENGCSKVDFFSQEEKTALNIVRVPNVEKQPLKALQIKKLKNNRRKRV